MRRAPPTSKHPTFKPIWIGTRIWEQPHMRIPRISKMVPAKDSWHGCFEEVTVGVEHEFVSGKVEVNLFPDFRGVLYDKQTNVQEWGWRITIWGNDDTYAEKYFSVLEDAQATFDALDQCPKMQTIFSEWGFYVS